MNILIVGGTSGIGFGLAKNLVLNNNLFIGSRSTSNVSRCVDELSSTKTNDVSVYGETLEASSFESVEKFISKAYEKLNSIDVIINCSGSILLKPPHMLKKEEVEKVFGVNAYSCLALLKYGFPFMKTNGGSFIFFSSAASKIGLKNHEVISGAKGAVSSIALSAASTYANYNIRVNVIAPGLVDTPMTKKIIENKVSLDYSKKMHGLNRIGKIDNFVPIVNSLIDKNSDWITGQTIFVDGGLSNVK